MSKGKLSYNKWHVSDMGWDSYLAERWIDKKLESHELTAHCLTCAKTEVLAKWGGEVDLRGSHLTLWGSFLRAMAIGN